ncbi:hypothetical protein SanaruYs_18250 [Chryseotalea sanaruensis]|uniref:Uncharacterized protein n=1 Tax=Chryseotalea sanaruensis TaxID=2482724 RepID=A0A401U9N8_9BACT|nr:hypothetical protein [Chryseotalea sanaruensis]GCC51599.1 hypothetical protein SanaruYs_18250 [Chryseotalea sanaruensis]
MEKNTDEGKQRKQFKQYLFEGLMIFLAITLGFFADNMRESLGQRSRANELAISMKQDLVKDTIIIDNLIDFQFKRITINDSLFSMIASNLEQIDQSQYYMAIRSMTGTTFFKPSGISASNLKELGLLDVLNDQQLFHLVVKYDSLFEDYLGIKNLEMSYQLKYMQSINRVTDPDILRKTYRHNINRDFITTPRIIPNGKGVPLLNPDDVTEFKGMLTSIRFISTSTIYEFQDIKRVAREMIQHIENNYN